jgi:hypothetical protein
MRRGRREVGIINPTTPINNPMDLLKPILLGYVRHGLTVGAGYLLAHGLVQQSDTQVIVSAGLALAGVAWSTINKLIQSHELRKAQNGNHP